MIEATGAISSRLAGQLVLEHITRSWQADAAQ